MGKTIIISSFNSSWLFIKTNKLFPVYVLLLVNTQLFAAEGFSEVNNALFDSPHMKNIKVPGSLNYLYKKSNIGEQTKEDKVSVNITNISDTGRTDQAYIFFTGDNKRPYQDRTKLLGNGIFMLFLEWDVHELERQTKGSWRHFQRRIRWAMAAGAAKKDVLISYQGKELKGTQYIIQPYVDDEKSVRYGTHANKYYTFTLSDGIPGTIYEVRTIVPKAKIWQQGDELITDERITFIGFTPGPVN
jgi:hypothetical protein